MLAVFFDYIELLFLQKPLIFSYFWWPKKYVFFDQKYGFKSIFSRKYRNSVENPSIFSKNSHNIFGLFL